MKTYEIMFIVRTVISEDEIKNVVKNLEDALKNNGAKIVESTDMGQRELAYEIKKYKTGRYFLITVESSDDKAVKEFDRLALINPDVIRHLITKLEK